MRELQAQIIHALHAVPEIDPAEELRRRVNLLKSYLLHTRLRGYVLGISGGQDSTLVGWLAQRAVRELREENPDVAVRFVALRLPYAVQGDEEDAQLALKFIEADETYTIDIAPATNDLVAQFTGQGVAIGDFNKGNIKARQRMVAHYALAGEWGLAVLGTDHAAEAVTGFYTKFGDGAADLMPLVGLNKRQGQQLLIEAGAPAPLHDKIPTADLLDTMPGQSDEESLGVTYEEIDDYLEGKTVSEPAAQIIEAKFLATRHKRHLPVNPFDEWWKTLDAV